MSTTARSSEVTLVRGLGALAAAALLIGDVIGTGVFLKARVMTCNVDTPSMVVAVWVVGGLLTLAGALTYAELAAMMPRAGGEYVFVRNAYGPLAGFLYGWTRFFVASTGGVAGLAAGFAIFANVVSKGSLERATWAVPLGDASPVFTGVHAIAVAAIVIVTAINCAAISFSGRVATGFTALKVALCLFVGVGAMMFADGSWANFALSSASASCADVSPAARGGAAGFGAAMLGAMWAYNGWNEVTYVAEEVKNPRRNLPLAIIGGVFGICALYISVNVAYFFVLSPAEIANLSPASSVATTVVTKVLGDRAATIMAGTLAMSIFGSLLIASLLCARVPYAMARDGLFFPQLAHLSPRTRVPIRALIAQAACGIVLVLSGSYDTITDYAIFIILIFVSLATASVYVFRRRFPDAERSYKTWGYPVTPAIFLVVSGWLVINTLMTTPGRALAGLGFMVLGIPFYWYWSRRRGPEDRDTSTL
jgi:basic amino acid/polyamine antiporter, APA family